MDGNMGTDFKTPPVHFTSSGAPYVEPADILRSKAGQEQIFKAARLEVNGKKVIDKEIAKP